MSVISCPACGVHHDGRTDSRGFATCRECAHCWQLKSQTSTERPTTSKPLRRLPSWGVSDEYAPGDSGDQPRTEPLTVREPSGVQAALPATPGDRPRRRPSSAENAMPEDFDSQLFERAERDAQVSRSQQETISAPNPVPTPDTGSTATCPVCGHRFAPIASQDQQRCPQCSTAFSLKTGDPVTVEAGGSDDNGIDDLIGITVRGCFVDRKLGEGGMGAVYHARQLSLDRSVAIKVMPAELTRNKNFIQRFEREAKSLARINHPNILHIYDFGEDQQHGIYFMIIEYVDGKDLGEILRARDVIEQVEALDILRQALLALETASEKGVIHRDIKPDNLMIAKDGTCKVSDFGLAKGYGDFTEVTTAGVRVGTPAFMSPEQCDGGDVDARSDVYSLGCTTYLALTGHLPFNGDSPFSIMLKHKTEPPPSLRKHRADIDPRVESLIQRMLAKRPEERCIQLRELITAVQDLEVALARNSELPQRKGSSERPRSLDDSGAARLLPDGPPAAIPVPDDAELPLALRGDEGQFGDLPKLDLGRPAPRTPPQSAPSIPPPAPAPLVLEPVDLPPSIPQPPADPARSSESRGRASSRSSSATQQARALRSSSDSHERPPVSSSSSALMHVQQGDQALSEGRPSEAIRQYNEAQQRRPSKDVGGKLADARKQQRHREASDLESSGDDLLRAGRYDEAIDDFMRASQQYSQVARREDLLRKVALAQRGKRRRRLVRLGFILIIVVALSGVGAYFATPELHNRWVEFQRQQANGLSAESERRAALLDIQAHQQPYGWYQTCFSRSYELAALTAVAEDIAALAATPNVDGRDLVGEREEQLVVGLEAAAQDGEVAWPKVVERGENLLRNLSRPEFRDRAAAVIATARGAVQAIEASIAVIDGLRASGRHAEALAKVSAFATEHPRAGGAWILPVPGSLQIETEATLTNLVVLVDGVPLVDNLSVFCRDPVKPTQIEITADGHLGERISVPPGAGDAPVVVKLQAGLRWQAQIEPKRPWWRLQIQAKRIAAVGPAGIALLDPVDGTALQVFKRSDVNVAPSLPNPTWNLVDLQAQASVVASSDGLVLRLAHTEDGRVESNELLRKGSAAVLGWLERELSFQSGRKTQVLIELSARQSRVVTFDGPSELWSQGGLTLKQSKPWLSATSDRILVVDDLGLRVFEEDGSPAGGYSLEGARSAPVATMAGGKILVIPTSVGVTLLRIGGQPHFVRTVADPALDRVGALAVASDDQGLVTADAMGALRLYEMVNDALVPRWQMALPEARKASGFLAINATTVVVVDDRNVIHLYDRATGTLKRSYSHPTMLAVAPLLIEDQLVVLDVSGVLTAYHVVR